MNNRQLFYLLIGFSLPVFFVFMLNVGIIFQIENHIGIFMNITNFLSENGSSNSATELMIGIATIFIVFFAFLQLGYSLQTVPHWFVNEYIFLHEYTLSYVAFFSSELIILAIFAVLPHIAEIDQILIEASLPVSILLTLIYFKWLSGIIVVDGMIGCIISRVDFKKIKDIEDFVEQNSINFENEKVASTQPYQIRKLKLDAPFFAEERIGYIDTGKKGIIISISLDEIEKLVFPISEHIEAIEFGVDIGDRFPTIHQTIMRLSPKYNNGENTQPVNKRIDLFVKDNAFRLEKCILIESKDYDDVLKTLLDILRCYDHVAHESPREINLLDHQLTNFIINVNWEKGERYSNIRKQLIYDFVNEMYEISQGFTTELQFSSMVPLVHCLRKLVVTWEDLRLLDAILRLMGHLLYGMLIKSEIYSQRVAAHVLYLKEITFPYTLSIQIESESVEDFQKRKEGFYNPLIKKSIRSAIDSIFYIIRYGDMKRENDIKGYLLHNLETLFSYLDGFIHEDKFTRDERILLVREFGKELLYLSIDMFRQYYYADKIPARWISEIALKVGENAFASGKYFTTKMERYFDELVFDYSFITDASFERYEDPDLATAATHIGGIYNFDEYWVLLSLNMKLKGGEFIPTVCSRNDEPVLKNLRNVFPNLKREKFCTILNINESQLSDKLTGYDQHLERLLLGLKYNEFKKTKQ